jgi:hypothetical protein
MSSRNRTEGEPRLPVPRLHLEEVEDLLDQFILHRLLQHNVVKAELCPQLDYFLVTRELAALQGESGEHRLLEVLTEELHYLLRVFGVEPAGEVIMRMLTEIRSTNRYPQCHDHVVLFIHLEVIYGHIGKLVLLHFDPVVGKGLRHLRIFIIDLLACGESRHNAVRGGKRGEKEIVGQVRKFGGHRDSQCGLEMLHRVEADRELVHQALFDGNGDGIDGCRS